jgi:hypothetical protein
MGTALLGLKPRQRAGGIAAMHGPQHQEGGRRAVDEVLTRDKAHLSRDRFQVLDVPQEAIPDAPGPTTQGTVLNADVCTERLCR